MKPNGRLVLTLLFPVLIGQPALADELTWEELSREVSSQSQAPTSLTPANTPFSNSDSGGTFSSPSTSSAVRQEQSNQSIYQGNVEIEATGNFNAAKATSYAQNTLPKVNNGPDILDESLKYHSQMSQMNGMNNQTRYNGNLAGAGYNQRGFNNNAAGNSAIYGGGAMPNQLNANNRFNAGNGRTNSPQINTQAVGAIGAAALIGTFLQNGGVGGMMRSAGWDNRRHTRGMSIGGY